MAIVPIFLSSSDDSSFRGSAAHALYAAGKSVVTRNVPRLSVTKNVFGFPLSPTIFMAILLNCFFSHAA